jgi:hypothetical protein
MSSKDGHREAILNANFTLAGVGVASTASDALTRELTGLGHPDRSQSGGDNHDELSPPRRRGETNLHAGLAGASCFPRKGADPP